MGAYAYERVLMHIREMMEKGEILEGGRLPPERQMAERFGVSRHAVRQALQSLGERGLVQRRQGSGSTLMVGSSDILAREMARLLAGEGSRLDALFEFRLLLEPEIAALAAARVKKEDLLRLEALVRTQEKGGDGGDLDARFHQCLAEATGNGVVCEVMASLAGLFNESRSRAWMHPRRMKRSLEGHKNILDALKAGDGQAARRAMAAHLEGVRESLVYGEGAQE
ncbi:FadR/GntR family transcriptional regulator [Desulfobotulus sp.]|jgi:GntR family transcriptional repressor for pyruvate dehydrogenase complex|uniref:FadR/GntR family transcriptional regulator n=1 Tax=Desulfobotulus sp. TaxID=1940337 RepID=UPI002A35CA3C|nr:FadR/GntR family transcriptional regulator [Desulfobotulus sp.]MDY0162338.1 FadR/GntR family transcriptional regulator [Desulfobotulus sp.]